MAATLALDVDDDDSVAAVREAVGAIDVLVNNAGFGLEGAVETVPLDEVRRLFETNFFGAARMIQAFVPAMRERGSGAVVNVTSVDGVVGRPLAGYYSATKFALEGLSESLHLEVGHFGVRVVVIEPGAIRRPFSDNAIDHRPEPGRTRSWPPCGRAQSDKLGGGADPRARSSSPPPSVRRSRPSPTAFAGRSAPTPTRHRRARVDELRRLRGQHPRGAPARLVVPWQRSDYPYTPREHSGRGRR